jgi:hypothetical protein
VIVVTCVPRCRSVAPAGAHRLAVAGAVGVPIIESRWPGSHASRHSERFSRWLPGNGVVEEPSHHLAERSTGVEGRGEKPLLALISRSESKCR